MLADAVHPTGSAHAEQMHRQEMLPDAVPATRLADAEQMHRQEMLDDAVAATRCDTRSADAKAGNVGWCCLYKKTSTC
jgi:hypothetical protein